MVDDASPGETAAVLDSYGDAIELVRSHERLAFGGACNAGAARAGGANLVFLNNDTLPASGWLDALLADAAAHPEAAISVGCKLLWPNNTVQHCGVVFDSERNARHAYAGFPAEHPAVNRSRAFQAVTAAAMLVRTEDFAALGGFDPAFANGWEDVDLCLRAGAAGRGVRCCHGAVLLRPGGRHPGSRVRRRPPELAAVSGALGRSRARGRPRSLR